ncbi:MAG: FecR domain-containing protein [Bacteroidales bacterium]
MNKNLPHSDKHSRFFEKTKIPYSRSKEDVWNDLMASISEKKKPAGKTRKLFFYWAAAAVFTLFISLFTFARFYTKTLYAPAGQHLSQTLPGKSKVHLNAGTKLKYHPYWWHFSRISELEGEAYFKVEKGKPFIVKSSQGETKVLGTQFNIFARNNEYRVYCINGKVQVKSTTGKKKILNTNQAVRVTVKGKMEYKANIKADQSIAWTKNQFIYTAAPLKEVLKEMERQFDITIEFDSNIEGKYTGNFQRGSSPETILKLIVRPFGLEVKQIHKTKYRITKEEN